MNENGGMKTILDKFSGHFDDYELFYLNEKGKKIEARYGEICAAEFKEEEGYALRAIKDARPVFAYTYDRDDPAARLVANAQTLLPAMEQDKDSLFAEPHAGYPASSLYDGPGSLSANEDKKSMLITMEKAIREYTAA